jgi:hypothetical protein
LPLYDVRGSCLKRAFFLLTVFASTAWAQDSGRLAAGVPLHVTLVKTAHIRVGAAVEAKLTEPVYAYDRLVLPAGSMLRGHVDRLIPAEKMVTIEARLNGDVTPLHEPVVLFDRLELPDGHVVALEAHARVRNVQFIRFEGTGKKPSLIAQGRALVRARIVEVRDAIFAPPGPKDRALRLLYSQLPYHPQRIWAGTGMVADVDSPAELDLPAAAPVAHSTDTSLDKLRVRARLVEDVSSATAKHGQAVTAIVTVPLLDSEKRLVVPEGAELEGLVAQAKPAKSFGRNGQLRLGFRELKGAVVESSADVQGTVVGAEGRKGSNETVDREGNVQAHPDKNRFVAPLLLAWAAMAGNDDDHHHEADQGIGAGNATVASNGFGVVARIIAVTTASRPAALGFGMFALAKSVYFRFCMRGHEVVFAKDTVVDVELSQRAAEAPAAVTR